MELILQLKGVMQSYGGENPWTATRNTNSKPTESAVKGMVECAFGLASFGVDEEDDEFRKQLWNGIAIEIPSLDHAPEILTDDQVIKPLIDNEEFQTANGGHKKVMPRVTKEYIVGECFKVILKGEQDKIEQIKYHLEHPVYPYSLGRACCIPSSPVVC